jgi:nucleotide-binding universal stress UspA family protein
MTCGPEPDRFDRMLVVLDGSAAGQRALRWSLALSGRLEAGLTALAVEGSLPRYAALAGEVDDERRRRDAKSQRLLDDACAQAEELEVDFMSERRAGRAAGAITRYAESHGHDLIVIGQQDCLLRRLIGSTAERVARRAHCPVVVIR